jgi:hypothetical protein
VNLFLNSKSGKLWPFSPQKTPLYVSKSYFTEVKKSQVLPKAKRPHSRRDQGNGTKSSLTHCSFYGGFSLLVGDFFSNEKKKKKKKTLMGVLITKFKRKTPSNGNKRFQHFRRILKKNHFHFL